VSIEGFAVVRSPVFVFVRTLLVVTAVLQGCTASYWSSSTPQTVIDTGRLQGAVVDGVHVFKGIPFAAPPVGELRWRAPEQPTAWSGVRQATDYGLNCAQIDPGILWFELGDVSEDCLNLNVWSPAAKTTDALPVMVWIHGGGYSNGSGNIPRLNSPGFASQGVVLVTINYRVSVFGFLNHPALAASQPGQPAANFGLLDVIASLEWVQRNIAAFGGDPDNVTIFGESAGAGIVNTLLVTPASAGLFDRAISQSASVGLAPDPYPDKRAGFLPPANKLGEAFAKKLGIADYKSAMPEVAAELRAMNTEQLLSVLQMADRYTPVVDGTILPDQVGALTAAGKQHAVPYITGGNTWEASLGREIGGGFSPEFAARLVPQADKERLYQGLADEALADQIFGDLIVLSGSRYTAQQMAAAGAPVYSYFLSYVATDRRDSQPGAAHTNDIAFVMRTLDNEADLQVISDSDRQVSDMLSAYWVQFARTGNPNREGLPAWPEFGASNGAILEVGDTVIIRDELLEERMEFHIARGSDLMNKVRN
jgi:para-nitrobenzyl esterase